MRSKVPGRPSKMLAVWLVLCSALGLLAPLLVPTAVQAAPERRAASVAEPPQRMDPRSPPSDAVRYRRLGSTCNFDGTNVDVGGRVFMGENGKRNVVQFKVEWRLSITDPRAPGYDRVYKHRTLSNTFPNDKRSFEWRSGDLWKDLNPTHTYWLYAKLKWVRDANRVDWVYSLPVAMCSASPS